MKKFILTILMVLSLAACCKESDIQNCVNSQNGLSEETCRHLMCN